MKTLLLVTLLLIGLFAFAYYQSIEVLLILWLGLEEVSDNSGLLAIACTCYLLYLKRDRFRVAPVRPNIWAGLLLVGFSLLWFVASETGIQSVQLGVLPFIMLATIAFAFGLPVARLSFIPVILLLFVIPIWWPLLPYLQVLTTAAAEFNLELINRPVFVDGFVLHLPGGSFLVDESCAGLRFLLVTALLTLVCKDMFTLSIPRTLLLGSVGVLLALLANWIRVLVIVLVGDYTNMQSGLVEDHANLGWVIYAILVLIPFFLLNNRLAGTGHGAAASLHGRAAKPVTGHRFLAFAVVAALALLSGPVLSLALDVQRDTERVLQLPAASGQISQLPAGAATDVGMWRPNFSNPTEILFGRYQVLQQTVDLHVIYYRDQQQGAELINVNNEFGDRTRWVEQSAGEHSVSLDGGNREFPVQELVLRGIDGRRQLVWYWYNVGGNTTISPVGAKVLEILALFSGRRDGWMTALSVSCAGTDCSQATNTLDRFMQAMYSQLDQMRQE